MGLTPTPDAVRTLLVQSVGGSLAPLVESLRHHRPAFVLWIASVNTPEQPGSEQLLPELLAAAPPDVPHALLAVADPDDLDGLSRAVADSLGDCLARFPGAQVVIDYTGGTKAMAAALALAAAELPGAQAFAWNFVGGRRDHLGAIDTLHPQLRGQAPAGIFERRMVSRLEAALARYDYVTVGEWAERLLRLETDETRSAALARLKGLAGAFDAWDRFDHLAAQVLLVAWYGPENPWLGRLEASMAGRALLDATFRYEGPRPACPLGVIQDLLANAERRAAQRRYDDAVGRLYRAVELLVQLHLKRTYGIETGALDFGCFPPETRAELEAQYPVNASGTRQCGLSRAYALLEFFPGDALFPIFSDHAVALQRALRRRNHSLFAHGFEPIDAAAFQAVRAPIVEFLEEALGVLSPELASAPLDFPQALERLLASESTMSGVLL